MTSLSLLTLDLQDALHSVFPVDIEEQGDAVQLDIVEEDLQRTTSSKALSEMKLTL